MQGNLVKEYNQMKRNFAQNYKTKFLPIAQEYEKKRKIISLIVIIVDVLLVGIWLFLTFGKNSISINSDNFILLALPAFLNWLVSEIINSKIKKEIMPEVCKCIGDLNWEQGHYENTHVMSLSKLIPDNWNRVSFDDVVTGQYKGVPIEIVEAVYKRETESTSTKRIRKVKGVRIRNKGGFQRQKKKRVQICFKGAFIVLSMNKNFKGNTIIKPDKFIKTAPSPEMKLTTLEDVVFEKKYDVFTTDEIEARYLITTSFMERLNEIKLAFKAKETSCAFYGGNLIIAFSGMKDLFSVFSLFKRADESKVYAQMFEEFLSIVKLIDHFKLDEKIGL